VTEPTPDTAYDAAAPAVRAYFHNHPDWIWPEHDYVADECPDCAAAARAAVDAVWSLALAAGVSEGRRQAAAEIEAAVDAMERIDSECMLINPDWVYEAIRIARLAEGKEDDGG
jgi:hypothetical protein